MSTENSRPARSAVTGWNERTRFVPVECDGEELSRARREAYGDGAVLVGCLAALPEADSPVSPEADSPLSHVPAGTVCSVVNDVIVHDGHAWLSVALWCPEISHLEILGEIMLTKH